MSKVMINQGRSLPLTIRFIGVLLVCVMVVLIVQNLPEQVAIPAAILASFFVPMIWFSNRILTIDNSIKEFHESVWIMGYKTGKPKKYNQIEKIYINKVNTSQQMYSRANVGHVSKGVEYRAFLKFDNEEKIFLVSDKSENRLVEKMTKIKEKLGIS